MPLNKQERVYNHIQLLILINSFWEKIIITNYALILKRQSIDRRITCN